MLRGQQDNLFLFGLAEENVVRLKKGEPIIVKLNEFGFTGPDITIFICYGETEEKLALDLAEVLGPQTTITDYRTKRNPVP